MRVYATGKCYFPSSCLLTARSWSCVTVHDVRHVARRELQDGGEPLAFSCAGKTSFARAERRNVSFAQTRSALTHEPENRSPVSLSVSC